MKRRKTTMNKMVQFMEDCGGRFASITTNTKSGGEQTLNCQFMNATNSYITVNIPKKGTKRLTKNSVKGYACNGTSLYC